jgi:hypothetical protein
LEGNAEDCADAPAAVHHEMGGREGTIGTGLFRLFSVLPYDNELSWSARLGWGSDGRSGSDLSAVWGAVLGR